MTRALALFATLVALAILPGCSCFSLGSGGEDTQPTSTTTGDRTPPAIAIHLPAWPPVGPSSVVTLDFTDDRELAWMSALFAKDVHQSLSGRAQTVTLTGPELGEGLGTLFVDCGDAAGNGESREVAQLLVDLTPPDAAIGATTIRPGDSLRVWVADAWVLGRAELAAGGTTIVHTFPEAYPDSIGTTWDASIVDFPAAALPLGKSPAKLTVVDGAGNQRAFDVALVVDATPPVVTSLTTTAASPVTGDFELTIDASDDLAESPQLEVFVGGTPAATAVGPHAVVTLSASDYANGATTIEVVAIDDAGNRSAPKTLDLDLE